MTRHLFVLNPASGRKDITQKLIQVINGLKLSDPYDIYVTEAPGSAEKECAKYLRAHKEDFTRIYSCGGDGTLSEVANGVYRSKVTNCAIAIVPIGSGNDFIRSFDVPMEDFRNIRKLTTANIMDIDLLVAREKTKTYAYLKLDGNRMVDLSSGKILYGADAKETLLSLIGRDVFAVLRPSAAQ